MQQFAMPVRQGTTAISDEFIFDADGEVLATFETPEDAATMVQIINRYAKLIALAESVERLNPACAEIGAGRLTQLVHDAKEALK